MSHKSIVFLNIRGSDQTLQHRFGDELTRAHKVAVCYPQQNSMKNNIYHVARLRRHRVIPSFFWNPRNKTPVFESSTRRQCWRAYFSTLSVKSTHQKAPKRLYNALWRPCLNWCSKARVARNGTTPERQYGNCGVGAMWGRCCQIVWAYWEPPHRGCVHCHSRHFFWEASTFTSCNFIVYATMALKKWKLTGGNMARGYLDIRLLLLTSNIRKRFYSKASYGLNAHFGNMVPTNAEEQYFFLINRSFWCISDIYAVVNKEKNLIATTVIILVSSKLLSIITVIPAIAMNSCEIITVISDIEIVTESFTFAVFFQYLILMSNK